MRRPNRRSPYWTDKNMTHPRPALTGNGEFVTTFGPTGYHTDDPIREMQVFCLAGRRYLDHPQGPLVRFGRLKRKLIVNGKESESSDFEQEVVPSQGIIISHNPHELVDEDTLSFVRLDDNSAAFHTTIKNKSGKKVKGKLVLGYCFGDWEGRVPEGWHFSIEQVHTGNGIALRFIRGNEHIGVLNLLCDRDAQFTGDGRSFTAEWDFDLKPGASSSVSFLFGIGDRMCYRQMPSKWSFKDLLSRQQEGWREYHSASNVSVGVPGLESLREICLYDIRCNSTPWSIPPCLTPTQWDGRVFHDEFFPFMGLISSGHADLARKIPLFRLHTLGKAVERSRFRGAKYPWEGFENGDDGSPYGHYIDEHFHMSQFGETAWQLCLHNGRKELREEFYPLLREIADYFLLNLVEPDGDLFRIKSCTDFDETVYPVVNGIYTACAAIRSMEIAARVAKELGRNSDKQQVWRKIAEGLRANLPKSSDGARFLTADAALHRHIAEAGVVFPFRVDAGSETALHTLDTFCEAVKTPFGLQPGNTPDYGSRSWLWTTAHIATSYSLIGQPDRALEVLSEAPNATGPGLTPAESLSEKGIMSAPWFTTGGGAYVFALSSLFVQVMDDGATKLPELPSDLPNASFSGLAGGSGLRISARYKSGRARELIIESPRRQTVEILLPDKHFPAAFIRWDVVGGWRREGTFRRVTLKPDKGVSRWTA